MFKPLNLTPAQLEEKARKLTKRSLLETLQYQSLIDELQKLLITNREPYLIKTCQEMEAYPLLLHYLISPTIPQSSSIPLSLSIYSSILT